MLTGGTGSAVTTPAAPGERHIITQHNQSVALPGGRQALAAFTYCGWLFTGGLEGAYAYNGWYETFTGTGGIRGPANGVCLSCFHVATCTSGEDEDCPGCEAGPNPYLPGSSQYEQAARILAASAAQQRPAAPGTP